MKKDIAMQKVLITATVPSMVGQFNLDNIYLLQNMGYQVDVATDFYDTSVWDRKKVKKFWSDMKKIGVRCFQISFTRNVWNIRGHLNAYRQSRKLLKWVKPEFIHTHTPVASAIVRIAAHQENIRVIYTAHGFHFYKGAALRNWLIYYPLEWLLSYWTDVLITINKEDCKRAKRRFHTKRTEYVHGVGIDVSIFRDEKIGTLEKRKSLNLKRDDIMLLSVGELNKNKNHSIVIRALAEMKNPQIHYFIAGSGILKEKLEQLSKKLGIGKQVHLLGYRNDVNQLLQIADIYLLPSQREGLNVSLMEAMASGVPCIVSRIRGNVDLISNSKCLVGADDVEGWKCAVKNMVNCIQSGQIPDVKKNEWQIRQYGISSVHKQMEDIYQSVIGKSQKKFGSDKN